MVDAYMKGDDIYQKKGKIKTRGRFVLKRTELPSKAKKIVHIFAISLEGATYLTIQCQTLETML